MRRRKGSLQFRCWHTQEVICFLFIPTFFQETQRNVNTTIYKTVKQLWLWFSDGTMWSASTLLVWVEIWTLAPLCLVWHLECSLVHRPNWRAKFLYMASRGLWESPFYRLLLLFYVLPHWNSIISDNGSEIILFQTSIFFTMCSSLRGRGLISELPSLPCGQISILIVSGVAREEEKWGVEYWDDWWNGKTDKALELQVINSVENWIT